MAAMDWNANVTNITGFLPNLKRLRVIIWKERQIPSIETTVVIPSTDWKSMDGYQYVNTHRAWLTKTSGKHLISGKILQAWFACVLQVIN